MLALAGCKKSSSGNASTAAASEKVTITQANPPPGGTWADVVNATSGGFVMGNPNARVKLIEFGSLTCPHCRAFDEEGVPVLVAKYVKTGRVSWEFRNYVRDSFDIAAALIARCNGARSFFPLTRALYKDQPKWLGKGAAVPDKQLQGMSNLPANKQFIAFGRASGLPQWAAARGIPQARSNQCLSNARSVDQLGQMANDATTQFPDFAGTPTFVINGTMLPRVATWDMLEPRLKNALGG
jgi:protein-disulfide isomerase